jgi:hypothetical protein
MVFTMQVEVEELLIIVNKPALGESVEVVADSILLHPV